MGQVDTKKQEITERVFYSGRKAVTAKDVAPTIESWEGELREYTNLTGHTVDNNLKVLNLKRILPEAIRRMLQTVQITGYSEAKEYALKQARVLQKEKDPKSTSLDLAEDGEEQVDKKRTEKEVKFEDDQNDEETYTHDELLAWIGKRAQERRQGKWQEGIQGQVRGELPLLWNLRPSHQRVQEEGRGHEGQGQGVRVIPRTGVGPSLPQQGKGKKEQWNVGPRQRVLWQGR